MEEALRKSGLFFGAIFLAGSAYAAVLDLVVIGSTLVDTILAPSFMLTFLVSLLFFGSVLWMRLKWIQPAIFLVISPYSISTDTASFFGLGLYVTAIILLYRLGFFDARRILKLALCFALYVLSEVSAIFLADGRPVDSLGSILFMVFFLAFLYIAFQEKLAAYLKEPKRELSLGAKGLSAAERAYTLALATGRSTREVAADYGVSESTVRNTLARSYRKLGLDDRNGLSALAERYKLVE